MPTATFHEETGGSTTACLTLAIHNMAGRVLPPGVKAKQEKKKRRLTTMPKDSNFVANFDLTRCNSPCGYPAQEGVALCHGHQHGKLACWVPRGSGDMFQNGVQQRGHAGIRRCAASMELLCGPTLQSTSQQVRHSPTMLYEEPIP